VKLTIAIFAIGAIVATTVVMMTTIQQALADKVGPNGEDENKQGRMGEFLSHDPNRDLDYGFSSDEKNLGEAGRIANDCYRYIMDLCTNAGIISDAMKFVTKKQEQIGTLHKLDEKIDAIEEEATATTNSVF
jgi:hypothetical protein